MKSILSLALLALLVLFAQADANGKTNLRPAKSLAQPASLHQSPKARLLRRIVAQQAARPQLQSQQVQQQQIPQRPIPQQRPIAQQPTAQRPAQQRPIVQSQKTIQSAIPPQQISVTAKKSSRTRQNAQRPISQAPRRVKVRINQSPQKSQRPTQQQQQQQQQQLPAIQSSKGLNVKQRPAAPIKSPVVKKIAQQPANQQPISQRPATPSNAESSEGDSPAPTGNPNALGGNNEIGLNNDIRDNNRISASNSISSSNTIRASNTISASNRINGDNAIRSANAIGASNSIGSSNSIRSSNAISSANRISASNSINADNSIIASNTIDATNFINAAGISDCGREGYSLSNRFCDKFYQCARLGNTLKLFEFQCTGGLVFDLNLKVCNYPRDREGCAFLYTGEGSDDGSYNENDLLGLSENNNENTSRLAEEEESGAGNNETAELEAQPPERSGPVTEGSNAALVEGAAPSNEEDSEAAW